MKGSILTSNRPVLRVVKTVQPVELIREMDQVILASGGAYSGRDEFITEAIRDRIVEERASAGGDTPASLATALTTPNSLLSKALATWDEASLVTLPAQSTDAALYGLHNRDYPTLWAGNELASMVAAADGPVSWGAFLNFVLEAAWAIGAQLQQLDRERKRGEMKAAIGFPTNADKRESSESRFLEHMLGIVRDESVRGPMFLFQLVGLARGTDELHAAPTEGGVNLLSALAGAGIGPRPPHSEDAWAAFREHLVLYAPAEFETWMRVLATAAAARQRGDAVGAFAVEWPGSAAESNVYGYVSRAREWGLLAPELVGGRYRLTRRGELALVEVNT